MRAVNLLPGDESGSGRKTPPVPVLVGCVGAVLVTALLAVLFLSASSSVAQQRQALQQAQTDYAAIPTPPAPSPVDSALPQQRTTRVTALAAALGQRIAWDRLLREVSQVVPSDVWLVTLNAQSPSILPPAPVTTGGPLPQGFTVTGCTYTQESVARFLARLDVVPDLSAMTLAKSVGGNGADASQCPSGMFTFTLNGNVRAAGAAS
ncbi:MAG TPA: PilN domain-containing protein [Gaiellaceae bacterium]